MSLRALFRTATLVLIAGLPVSAQTAPRVQTSFDESKNLTTVKLGPVHLSGDKAQYHSLDFTLKYDYPGTIKTIPKQVNFELVSVVKSRRLNTDLHVVFLINGKPVHFGSNRSAIRNPVPGRLWIGERMDFQIPYEDFESLSASTKISIKLGNIFFDFNDENRSMLKIFASTIKE
jgi:hypothetical protein